MVTHAAHHERIEEPAFFGLVAEFADPDLLVVAARAAREAGYRRMDAYSPFPIHGLAEAIEFNDPKVPWSIFIGGLTGCFMGFALQWYINCIDYPINIGGRPYLAWPSFIPVTFECTILFAALTAFFGMLALNGLPRPYHSIFNTPRFDLASQDRFFLCIESTDPKFDLTETRRFLETLNPTSVAAVEP